MNINVSATSLKDAISAFPQRVAAHVPPSFVDPDCTLRVEPAAVLAALGSLRS